MIIIMKCMCVSVDDDYMTFELNRVFKGEACDDLGGMFCEREYQRGVY